MAREKKDSIPVTYKIATEVNDMINELSDKSGCPKTGIVERAVKFYYEHEKEKEKQ